jgi:hypothetical protein
VLQHKLLKLASLTLNFFPLTVYKLTAVAATAWGSRTNQSITFNLKTAEIFNKKLFKKLESANLD